MADPDPNSDEARIEALLEQAADHRRNGRLVEQVHTLDRALNICPDHVPALRERADALVRMQRYTEAFRSAEKVLALVPDDAHALNNRANCLVTFGRSEEALADYDAAIFHEPLLPAAYENKAKLLAEIGRTQDAVDIIEHAVRLFPDRPRAYYELLQLRRLSPGEPHFAAMEALARRDANLSRNDSIHLYFALGRAYEAVNDFRPAFSCFARACAIKRRSEPYEAAAWIDELERAASAYGPDCFERLGGAGDSSRLPVFILGMPRSGTTLAEQILSSHSRVSGIGETDAMLGLAGGFLGRLGAGSAPESLAKLDRQSLRGLGAAYLRHVRKRAGVSSRLVDKSITNFPLAGLIHLALPNARFIHVRRNPLDCCASIFTSKFSGQHPYAYDLGELGQFYRAYDRLMQHWRAVLPPRVFLEVQYEDVVADLEGQSRRMLAHCGLQWDPAVLDFHKTQRPVLTASKVQVRQPIYSSSIGRWRNYEPWLGPLIEALGPELAHT